MTEPKLKEVIVATDFTTGDEAIYVDGKKVFEDDTVYACDIESAASVPMNFHHMTVELDGEFPESASELLPFETGTNAVSDVLAESKEGDK
jgi:hypothetical protein